MGEGFIPVFWFMCDHFIESTSSSTKIFWNTNLTHFLLLLQTYDVDPIRHDVLQQFLENEGLRNKMKANSGVRSWRFYRSSTRLSASGRVLRVALWGGFCLGAGWYPRLEPFLRDE